MLPNKKLKSVLIYGDSYTYGKIPNGGRYDSEQRFTGITQKILQDNVEIIEEGLRGRTIAGDNLFFPHRDGLQQFDGIIGSHLPLDLVILFLGTNDINSGSTKEPREIVMGYRTYLAKLAWWTKHLDFSIPKVAILAPPIIDEEKSYESFQNIFKGSQQKSSALPAAIQKFAEQENVEFYDTSTKVSVSSKDGIHLDQYANRILGNELAKFINLIL